MNQYNKLRANVFSSSKTETSDRLVIKADSMLYHPFTFFSQRTVYKTVQNFEVSKILVSYFHNFIWMH